jgi:hypothetical protein
VENQGMKITVLGALLILAAVVLLALVIHYLAGEDWTDPTNLNQSNP